ncbi:uncharacterized protein HD556DRAFT_1314857 [Suillus plorans]|uniref:Uncharacterized protein n=1 Tax=Suillus plorans TaxID=116603 RepID=A0A9P7DA61_9AGAM|nr:uncharacterized protein HD556DRAFT_1314857 [Suillus plorans]KAG1784682.1 hypothetical protein HD556DRAFT_1314857 [Suillus plorans]
MNVDTLYKAFKAVLASREVTHLQVATSLWQVECTECMTALNQALHKENRAHLNIKNEQLKKIRNFFSERHRAEIDDNTNYPQAVYDNECEMLYAITTQADLVSRCLGPGARHELLASTGEGPYLPRFLFCKDRVKYPHMYYYINSQCGPQRKSKAKVPKPPRGSGLNPSAQHGHSYRGTQSTGFETTPQHGHSYSGTQSPSFNNQSSWDFFQNQPSFEAPPQGSYPNEHYSFQGATGSTASTNGGPSKTRKETRESTADATNTTDGSLPNNPPTDPIRNRKLNVADFSDATINQTMKGAMKLVTRELFSLNAMTINKALKKAMLTMVIWDSLLQCFGPNTMVTNFITSKRQGEVTNTFTMPPVIYRKRVVDKIAMEGNRLTFMHIYTFDQDGRIQIKAKFQNSFIMANVIRFVWFSLHQEFLSKTEEEQLERMKYIWALSSTATFCSLDEQYEIHVQMDPFGGMSGNRKFLAIVKAMDDLMDDEKAEFHRFLQYVLLVGLTQALSS